MLWKVGLFSENKNETEDLDNWWIKNKKNMYVYAGKTPSIYKIRVK